MYLMDLRYLMDLFEHSFDGFPIHNSRPWQNAKNGLSDSANSVLAESQSPPQELEGSQRSRLYILVQYIILSMVY